MVITPLWRSCIGHHGCKKSAAPSVIVCLICKNAGQEFSKFFELNKQLWTYQVHLLLYQLWLKHNYGA